MGGAAGWSEETVLAGIQAAQPKEGPAPRVTPSMPAGGLQARGHHSLALGSLGDPALVVMGKAPSHLPDSGQTFPLILPKFVHFTPALGRASCRALGCHLPSFRLAIVGSTLLKCKFDPITSC